MSNNNLRKNQSNAVKISVENDFTSGVHFHATGTGKSWIGFELLLEYNNKYPKNNVLWLCEQKSILIEQFSKKSLEEKGYVDIYKKFIVINYSEIKPKNWMERVNNAIFWNKSILFIINRSFLVSQCKYKKLKMNINMIIHDECHSIQNKTTQEFYEYIDFKNCKCLGFSATPNLNIKPYDNIISTYTIYDAFCDNVILPPKIVWIESISILNDIDYIMLCKKYINQLYYKKIIIWCGIIDKCYDLYKLWKIHFSNFSIHLDTSLDNNDDFNKFSNLESNCILFCACKHREGSDIKNLDCCIFLDKVKNRNSKTFIQCIGRVLRKDKNNNKVYGLILDLKAESCIKVCDRMNEYLNCSDKFPWDYKYIYTELNNKKVCIHELLLTKSICKKQNIKQYDINDIRNKFIRKIPDKNEYKIRLEFELDIIQRKNLENYLLRAIEILELTNFIPHVTRGSCGSSLVCYLLGISNVDPIKENISFARFLNEYRENLPDIDFDFPHYLRDEVFLKLQLNWPNQVARISNHVHWHEKSALRESIRKIGYNKRIPKEDLTKFINNLSEENRKKINKYKNELENTFRHYSLHCGGIIFFNDGVPEELKLNSKTLSQIMYDKRDVSKNKNFKIDILSSRGISQLMYIMGNNIDFTDCKYDKKTYELLQSGNNIGITLAESPLMRKALIKIKPKTIKDIAICLSIIRPAAKDTNNEINTINTKNAFIFDDDAINLLSNELKIDEDLADKFRRIITKNKWNNNDKELYDNLCDKLEESERINLEKTLSNLQLYSFCKSHAYSYAQLVYKLAYQKANNPKKFWESTLKNSCSAYRKWVHLYEASRNGVNIIKFIKNSKDCSIYAEKKRIDFTKLSIEEQMIKYGYWDMTKYNFLPNCYFYKEDNEYLFNGIIANIKVLNFNKKLTILFVCVPPGKYIEILSNKNTYIKKKSYGVKGRLLLKNANEQIYNSIFLKFY
tara:strand:- start:9255 stop:12143 length:2889 start_codon:yes stop_codon:yes gene_type:complete